MMEGLKDALQYITGLKEEGMDPKVLTIEGETYCDKKLTKYHNFPMAEPLNVNTLTSIVDYIKGRREELREATIIHIVSPSRVRLLSGLIDRRDREVLVESCAIINEFRFDKYYDQERFLIELQASGTTANYDDDGVSQKTTIKSGIANNTDVIVPNPVRLRPYRTFAEIEQPESEYVFRIMDDGQGPSFKLVEADGGLWKSAAMMKIKEYFNLALTDEMSDGALTIIA